MEAVSLIARGAVGVLAGSAKGVFVAAGETGEAAGAAGCVTASCAEVATTVAQTAKPNDAAKRIAFPLRARHEWERRAVVDTCVMVVCS